MSQKSRRHSRSHFYKYMPAETAVKVLASRRLRWSSPTRFNDPFDVPRTLAYGFEPQHIAQAVSDLLNEYLDQPPHDVGEFDPSLAALLTIAKGGLPEVRPNPPARRGR